MTLRDVVKAVTTGDKVNKEDIPYFADWLLDNGREDVAADVRDCEGIKAYGTAWPLDGRDLPVQTFNTGRIYRVSDAEGYVLLSIWYKLERMKA